MPRGERDRRRKIEEQISNHCQTGPTAEKTGRGNGTINTGNPDVLNGLVVESGSGMCRVDINGDLYLCDIKGSLKDAATGYINIIAVGDRVVVNPNGHKKGRIEAIEPRMNVFSRPYSPDVGKSSDMEQIIAANIDQVIIVASWREPYIWPALIDRYLITAALKNMEAYVCVNKIDLIEDENRFQKTISVYQSLGYKLLLTSVITEFGVQDLKEILEKKISVFTGLSGVGKSSLLKKINPDLDLRTNTVIEHGLLTGQGKHTTTQSSLWKIGGQGLVIDTPGIKSFEIAGLQPDELASWYPEMISPANNCRFRNCTHINEPDCGVTSAVNSGRISQLRYKNYTQIFGALTNP
jgi:ribosome biogenesis GTPase